MQKRKRKYRRSMMGAEKRKKYLEFFEYTCCSCCTNFEKHPEVLEAHHIDEPNDHSTGNVVVLCANCHKKQHHKDRKMTKNLREMLAVARPYVQKTTNTTEFIINMESNTPTELEREIRNSLIPFCCGE